LKFAIIGDNGTGDRLQYETAATLIAVRQRFPFAFVLMLGDNMYGSQRPADYVTKFSRPYAALLEAGVTFHATLGNHDDPDQRLYAPFGMNGQRYYTFARGGVRFVSLDATNLDAPQLAWFEAEMAKATESWRIAYFHYPLYSNAGSHGSDVELRVRLEPLLVRYGIDVVLTGHDHVYERFKPQKGITHFVAGSGGKLRKGDLRPSPLTAAGFDQDNVFLIAEVVGDAMHFQAISRTGAVVDSGVIASFVD
jgi:3',5'-cyclic AMP phosphodiesterase CpdA